MASKPSASAAPSHNEKRREDLEPLALVPNDSEDDPALASVTAAAVGQADSAVVDRGSQRQVGAEELGVPTPQRRSVSRLTEVRQFFFVGSWSK